MEELRGIAEGSGVDLDAIWVTNLIAELDPLLPALVRVEGCSDLYGHDKDSGAAVHGHNEDWSEEVKPLW